MKKLLVCLFVGALSLPSVAYETQLGDTGTVCMIRNGSHSYSLKILDDGFAGHAAGTILPSFCLEKGEHFTPGTDYFGVINDGAIYGGPDWQNGIFEQGRISRNGGTIDRIDERSAYLFTQYYNDYQTGNSSEWNENALQQAFHYIEAERNWFGLSRAARRYVSLADEAVDNGTWSGLGNVRAVNLWKNEKGVDDWAMRVQDQLIMIVPVSVPAPGALLLAGIGTLLVGFLRRRGRE